MTGAGSGGQGPPDGAEPEEEERCPICLGVLAGGDLAMPDSCCHVFCLGCLLTWAESQTVPSCPVDRRPFDHVYKWDPTLGCVQVPVRKRASQPDAERCCCRSPETSACLKSKQGRRLRRQKTERPPDAKTKGLVRKCSDDDPSSMSRKKVRGTQCCTWSPSPFASLTGSLAQDMAGPVWVAEETPYDAELKQCKPQTQDCPWLSPAAPIPASGTSRHSFHPTNWNHVLFPFGPSSSPFTSNTSFGSGHFVFQGRVCAVTCPKGGEKRGGRASGSKAPTKEAESVPSRRSGRNSKAQEPTPTPDASPPPQSHSSDSDSSTSQPTRAGKASQVPAKKKGKQVTNRKASGKRKAPARKKPSPRVVSSPTASEEEENEGSNEEQKAEEEDDVDKEQLMNNSELEHSDAAGSPKADHDGSSSADEQGSTGALNDDAGHDEDETQEQSDEHEQKPEEENQSLASNSPPNSPGSCSGRDQGEEEEPEETEEPEKPGSPVSPGEKDSEETNSPLPPFSHNGLSEDPKSPHSSQEEEQGDKKEICADSPEVKDEDVSPEEVKTEVCQISSQPGSPSAAELHQDLAPEEEASEDTDAKKLSSEEEHSTEDKSGEGSKDSPSKDDTNTVPMDCSSPGSEHCDNPVLDPPSKSTASADADPSAPAGLVAKEDGDKDRREREREKSPERSQERKNGKQRRSRFHSPTSTWSPKRESRRDSSRRSRSRSRERNGSPPSSRSSRARSRERDRDRDGERDHSRRERSRERKRRRSRSRSKSKSRSRSRSKSRSRSRTRPYRRGPSPEWPASGEQSPQRKDRRGGGGGSGGGGGGRGGGGGWRSGQSGGTGSDTWRYGGTGRFENGGPTETSPDRQSRSNNPDWVLEKTRSDAESRNRDDQRNSGGDSWTRGGWGGSDRGRGAGQGGCNRFTYNQQGESADNRWPRNNFSGTGSNSGNDAYSRFNENRGGGRRKDADPGDMMDRSGWSSASSWAVRRTLPADVQDYYSRRERGGGGGGSGGWNRQEEEQTASAEPPKAEPLPQTVPGNAPVPVVNMMPPQLNVLHHHYPMQGPRGALPVALQPAAPYAMPPQVSMHLHPAVPLLQVPAIGAHGLPPPPPPPPPMQQGSQTAAQPDGHATQMASGQMGYGKPPLLPTPTKAGFAMATHGHQTASQALPSSTTQPGQHKAHADSSKKDKKQQIQERAINEVKTAIKPYYQKKEITKEEYKEIVRKAVEKVCHSKSGEVNSSKVANLVKAYVDKYKHARKK
ncbi:uncharacterized protein scaf11 [Diretmus argenteus]